MIVRDAKNIESARRVSDKHALIGALLCRLFCRRGLPHVGYKTFQISVQQVVDETDLDFRSLVEFDGFSQFEAASGEKVEEELESLRQIRI